jgi:hypothetical protein
MKTQIIVSQFKVYPEKQSNEKPNCEKQLVGKVALFESQSQPQCIAEAAKQDLKQPT